jgi:hypothetical protein
MLEAAPPSQLSQVISQSIAPAFILGAVASFISVLVTRLNRIIDRCRLIAGRDQNQGSPDLVGVVDISRLNARAELINRAIFWAVGSALSSLLLMIVAFISAFLEPHERGVGFLFLVALVLFGASLTYFGREIRIVIKDPNNFD